MADYNPILDAETDPEAGLRSSLFKRLAANPIAAFEGAAGAPRLADGAFDKDATATADLATWIGNRYGLITAGAIGSLAFAKRATGGTSAFGTTLAGSSLETTNAAAVGGGTTLSGTWRCLGTTTNASDVSRTTLWIRIA